MNKTGLVYDGEARVVIDDLDQVFSQIFPVRRFPTQLTCNWKNRLELYLRFAEHWYHTDGQTLVISRVQSISNKRGSYREFLDLLMKSERFDWISIESPFDWTVPIYERRGFTIHREGQVINSCTLNLKERRHVPIPSSALLSVE